MNSRDCDDCGASNTVHLKLVNESFPYGVGPNTIELQVEAPVWVCSACGCGYGESEWAEARDEAVRNHLRSKTNAQMD